MGIFDVRDDVLNFGLVSCMVDTIYFSNACHTKQVVCFIVRLKVFCHHSLYFCTDDGIMIRIV